MNTKQLAGSWRKIGEQACAEAYPQTLEFRDGDIYLSAAAEGAFSIWQSGDYEMVEGDRIRMQTANDAMVAYEISAPRADVIRFVDGAGCVVEYERVSGGR